MEFILIIIRSISFELLSYLVESQNYFIFLSQRTIFYFSIFPTTDSFDQNYPL